MEKRSSRDGGKPSGKRPRTSDQLRTVRLKEVVEQLEHLRHRAVILDALATHVHHQFYAPSGSRPRYQIAGPAGNMIPCPEVVADIEQDLRDKAEQARIHCDEILTAQVSGLPDADQPVPRPKQARAKKTRARVDEKPVVNPTSKAKSGAGMLSYESLES